MRLAYVDPEGHSLEVVLDARVVVGMDAHADPRGPRVHVAPEDLDDAELSRALRLILEADHPQGDHVRWVVERADPRLEEPVCRRVEGARYVLLPDRDPVAEAVLPDATAEWSRGHPGLERGDAQLPVELGAPGPLVSLDDEAQPAIADPVTGSSGGR
jgi:hypothetical protein